MPVAEIDEVITALDAVVDRSLAERSRVGYFAAMYRQVTLAVKRGIEDGLFEDGPRMSRFDAAFADRYLDALGRWTAQAAPPKSWKIAFEATGRDDRVVIQHLLLGINAHINLDLGIAAARTAPGEAIFGLEKDFDRINDILVAVLHEMQDVLNGLSPLMKILDDIGCRNDEEIVKFNVREAREDAWDHAVVLARQDPAEVERTLAVLDRKVALLGRILNDPGPLLRPALELIRRTEEDDPARVIEALNAPISLTAPR
jgi:hypothetical protein